jgi:hypothetical protein
MSARIARLRAEIWTWDLPNTNQSDNRPATTFGDCCKWSFFRRFSPSICWFLWRYQFCFAGFTVLLLVPVQYIHFYFCGLWVNLLFIGREIPCKYNGHPTYMCTMHAIIIIIIIIHTLNNDNISTGQTHRPKLWYMYLLAVYFAYSVVNNTNFCNTPNVAAVLWILSTLPI